MSGKPIAVLCPVLPASSEWEVRYELNNRLHVTKVTSSSALEASASVKRKNPGAIIRGVYESS